MSIALLIIDLQKAYLKDRKGDPKYKMTFEYINETSKLFRQSGQPVIVIRDLEGEDSDEYQNAEDLITEKSDINIIKHYSNGFWKTDLEKILKEKDIELVVLCGMAAEFCVLATYNGALERGFKPVMLQNGLFAGSELGLKDAALNRSLISYQAISYITNLLNKK